jgi:hypothetical protein
MLGDKPKPDRAMVMLHNGADHTTIAMHDQPARKPLSRSVNRVTSMVFGNVDSSPRALT